jgi:PAS domain S-box-containing protein
MYYQSPCRNCGGFFVGKGLPMSKKPTYEELEKKASQLERRVKRLEKEAKRRRMVEEKWLSFMRSSTEGFSLYDSKLNLLEINEAGLGMLPAGAKKEDLIGRNLSEIVPDSKVTGRYERFEEVVKTGEPFSDDNVLPPPDFGEDTHMNIKAFKISDGLGIINTDITARKQVERALRKRESELAIKNLNLEEANIALKVLLKKRDIDKVELEEKLLINIKELVEPYLRKLAQSGLDERQKNYVKILESNLDDIVSPLSHTLSAKEFNFTSMEIKVANLIKQGRTTQEIADLLNVSNKTVSFHRANIRKKIGIKNKRANLRSNLLSLH